MLALVIEPPESRVKKPDIKASPAPAATPTPAVPPPVAPARRTSMNQQPARSIVMRVSAAVRDSGRARLLPSRMGNRLAGRLALPGLRTAISYQTQTAAPAKAAVPAGATPAAAPAAAVQGRPTPAPRGARAAGAPRGNVPILTLERFEQAMQIARLAAEHDMPDLSLRAVRQALMGGPPVVPANPNARRVMMRTASGLVMDEGPGDQATPKVIASLSDLERIWQKHKVADAAVYDALRDAVMPAGRPAELFLYAVPVNAGNLIHPASAGAMLAARAVKAGKADDLKKAIAARKSQVMAQLAATVLSAQLALATNDTALAAAALAELGGQLKTNSSKSASELACQAALPALSRREPELARAAMLVLDAASHVYENSGQPEPLTSLLVTMARRQFELGDAADAKKRLESFLEAAEKSTLNYGGDYPLYLRKQNLERVAAELARAGLWSEALTALGRFVDAPAYSGGDPPVDETLRRLLGQLADKPAKERYDTLHAWTMPTKDRKVARILTTMATTETAPAVFLKSTAAKKPDSQPRPAEGHEAAVSTASALIEAARQAGKLDELAAEARAAAELKDDKKVENAEVLSLQIEMARGQGAQVAPRIEARVAELTKEDEAHKAATAAPPGPPRPTRFNPRQDRLVFPWTDYLVVKAALASNETKVRDAGIRLLQKLVDRAMNTGTTTILPRLRIDSAVAAARATGVAAPFPPDDSGLALWHAADTPANDIGRGAATPAPCFLAHDGVIAHIGGSGMDHLLFDYPVTGTYEFSADAYLGWFAESGIIQGGLILETSGGQVGGLIFPVGGSEAMHKPFFKYNQVGRFNRITVQATPRKVRYLINGYLFHEDDDPSSTSPWLGLSTRAVRLTAWHNVSISGKPTIPREVTLSQGDRLEGWDASFYGESQPPRRTEETTDQWGNVMRTGPGMAGFRAARKARPKKTREPVKLDDYDWVAQDGVIHGRRLLSGEPKPASRRGIVQFNSGGESSSEASQSVLMYFRPLRGGDTLSYEFLYEPDQVAVHPALGRLAFLLEPDGVKVHYLTLGPNDFSGIAADNAADEPANRRGPKPLPLKTGAWNTVKLALEGDKLTIELNGQAIYERPLERELGRQFSLFHFKDRTAAQARNVVLKGRWPESFTTEQLANLMAPSSSAPNLRPIAARFTA